MPQQIPLTISVAPFPEGFSGDMDETFQQFTQLMEAFIEGNFLTGLILPPGSTLPTTNQGPIAMGNQWYFWDPATNQYLPQTVSAKVPTNYAKNPIYQVQQIATPTIAAGINQIYDMALTRCTQASVLAIAPDIGPAATTDNDYCPSAIKYTVGPTLVPTLGSADFYAHEHLIEGSDLSMARGSVLSLSFSVWTNVPGVYSVYLTSGARDASWTNNFTIASGQINTWVRIKYNAIPAIPTGTGTWNFAEGVTGMYIGFPLGMGAQWQTASPNKWNAGLFCGTSSNTNLLTVNNNQMKISGIKLESSPATGFLTAPSFAADYDACIRYYFTTFTYQSVNTGTTVFGVAYTAGTFGYGGIFPRRMCKVPSVVPYSASTFSAGNVRNVSANADVALATLGSNPKGYSGFPTLAGAAKGDVIAFYFVADARLS
jgi:hypothetical protein